MKLNREKGFTLVEMAIVLVIIGIILASVMKGRDLIHSASESQVEQAFMQKWVTMVNDYNKATGRVLADGVRSGGTATVQDGWMDDYNITGNGTPLGVGAGANDILNALGGVGIGYCQLVKSTIRDLDNEGVGNEMRCPDSLNVFATVVDSEYSGKKRIAVALGSYTFTGLNGSATPQRKNVLIFRNVPLDIAVRFDRVVDGTEGGIYGSVINLSGAGVTPSAANIGNILDAPATGTTIALTTGTYNWPRLTAASRANIFSVAYILDH